MHIFYSRSSTFPSLISSSAQGHVAISRIHYRKGEEQRDAVEDGWIEVNRVFLASCTIHFRISRTLKIVGYSRKIR